MTDTRKAMEMALRRAYQLGKDYLEHGDGYSWEPNRKADEARRKFETLVEETCVALAQQGEPVSGWKLVPLEPTEEMLRADVYTESFIGIEDARTIYRAMLAAAPAAQQGADK